MIRERELERLKKGNHIKPLSELAPFPIDICQMKIRNRKLLASLNQKKRFKDFEYKNYDSTDSDLYEEEDYLKITMNQIEQEPDFLRQRRLLRRIKVKKEILQKQKQDKEEAIRRGTRATSYQNQPKKRTTLYRKHADDEGIAIKSPKNSKMLNEIFQECIIPRMHRI